MKPHLVWDSEKFWRGFGRWKSANWAAQEERNQKKREERAAKRRERRRHRLPPPDQPQPD